MRGTIFRIVLCGTAAWGLALAGCPSGADTGPETPIRFADPNITLYVEADPAGVAASLQSQGLTVQAGDQIAPRLGLDFLVTGQGGTITWHGNVVQVEADGVRINGTFVASDDSVLPADRTVVLTADGQVIPDAFLPFERPYQGLSCLGNPSRQDLVR